MLNTTCVICVDMSGSKLLHTHGMNKRLCGVIRDFNNDLLSDSETDNFLALAVSVISYIMHLALLGEELNVSLLL